MSLFEIESKEIINLEVLQFVDFANRMIRAEGGRIGLSPSNIFTSLRIYNSDKGIDAKITDNQKESRWLSDNGSIWQYRTGNITEREIRKEIDSHPIVQQYVKDGYTYFLCNSQEYIPEEETDFERIMADAFTKHSIQSPKVKFYSAQKLAEWASEIPALSFLPMFGHPIGDTIRYEKWAKFERFQQPYIADEKRQEIQRKVTYHFFGGGDLSHLRIEGLAGVGKTRLALECLKPQNIDTSNENGINEISIYALSTSDIPKGIFSWMEAHSNANLILVVDECDKVEADRLQQQVERCEGRVKLLTIGLAKEAKFVRDYPQNIFLLEKLDDLSMEKLLKNAYKSLPKEAISFITRFSSGYVKLATVIAKKIQEMPTAASASDLLKTYKVREILDKFLIPNPDDRKIMQGVALLSRLGWDEKLIVEGQILMSFLNVDWRIAQSTVEKYVNDGLIVKQGRYRYVTPHLLAILLATEAWNAYGHDIIEQLLPKLPNRSCRISLLERLRDLGDHPKIAEVSEYLLQKKIFPDLKSINSGERARIFSILAESNPLAGMDALERIICHLSRDYLLNFVEGRRQIIWLLEKLAWIPEIFFRAARLLLQLADAENEVYGNNATNTWVGLFKTYLGGSAIPAAERHILIKEALDSDSLEKKKLAIKAIEISLSYGHEYRMGGSEIQGRIVPVEWRPKTKDEDKQVRLSAFKLWDYAFSCGNPLLVNDTMNTLIKISRGMIAMGLGNEVFIRLNTISTINDSIKLQVRETTEEILKWEKPYLSDEQSTKFNILLDQLRGNTFSERLKRWIGKWTLLDYEKDISEINLEIKKLVEEGINNPYLIETELEWIMSEEAENIFFFGKFLGELDTKCIWFKTLEKYVRINRGVAFVSAYLHGHTIAGRQKFRDDILDKWINNKEMAHIILDVIWRSTPSDDDAKRLIKLIENGYLQPEKLGILIWGGQTRYFSKESFYHLIEAIKSKFGISEVAITATQLLAQRLDFKPDETEYLSVFVWQLLEKSQPIYTNGMALHDREHLIKKYIKQDPLRSAKIILKMYEREDSSLSLDINLKELINQVTSLAPNEVWQLVSTYLLKKDRIGTILRYELKGWYAIMFDMKMMLDWAKNHLPEGPYIIALLTPVHAAPLYQLARELLILYGDNKDIKSALYSNFSEGTFSGPISKHYELQLSIAEQWLRDPAPKVREWALPLVEELKREIVREKQREEEELY